MQFILISETPTQSDDTQTHTKLAASIILFILFETKFIRRIQFFD